MAKKKGKQRAEKTDPLDTSTVHPAVVHPPLNLRQQLYLQYLTDPNQLDNEGQHTFDNQRRAYALAYGVGLHSADPRASMVRHGKLKSRLEQMAEASGAGVKVRMGALRDIVAGIAPHQARSKTWEYYTDKDGKQHRRLSQVVETETSTRNADRIRAAQVLNKMTGIDAINEAQREVATREARDLYERMVRPGRRDQAAEPAAQAERDATPPQAQQRDGNTASSPEAPEGTHEGLT